MAGHIQQRGETSWRLHAFIGRDANGRKRHATKTVHGTKREADRALAAFVTEVSRDRSASAAAQPMTVSHVLTKVARRQVRTPVAGHRGPIQGGDQAH